MLLSEQLSLVFETALHYHLLWYHSCTVSTAFPSLLMQDENVLFPSAGPVVRGKRAPMGARRIDVLLGERGTWHSFRMSFVMMLVIATFL